VAPGGLAPTEWEALRLAQQLLDLYKPKVALEHPEAQYALTREFIPGEPLSSGVYLRRGSVLWAASAVPPPLPRSATGAASCSVRCARRPGDRSPWDPWMTVLQAFLFSLYQLLALADE